MWTHWELNPELYNANVAVYRLPMSPIYFTGRMQYSTVETWARFVNYIIVARLPKAY